MSCGPYREGKTGCSNQSSTSAGFRNDNKVSIYSSPDLMKWSKVASSRLTRQPTSWYIFSSKSHLECNDKKICIIDQSNGLAISI